MTGRDALVLVITASSGWAIFDRGERHSSGVAASTSQRLDVIDDVEELLAGDMGHPRSRFAVVREECRARDLSPEALLAIGATWGRWAEQLEQGGMAARRIVTLPADVELALGRPGRIITSADVAEAIGAWALTAPEVAAVLPEPEAPARPKLALVRGVK